MNVGRGLDPLHTTRPEGLTLTVLATVANRLVGVNRPMFGVLVTFTFELREQGPPWKLDADNVGELERSGGADMAFAGKVATSVETSLSSTAMAVTHSPRMLMSWSWHIVDMFVSNTLVIGNWKEVHIFVKGAPNQVTSWTCLSNRSFSYLVA